MTKTATIEIKSCKECDGRCDASWKAKNWRNVYCDYDIGHKGGPRSITEEDDKKGFPSWCPLFKDNKPLLRCHGQEVMSFTYKGTQTMLGSFSLGDPIPKVNPRFRVQLRLKDGSLVDAPPSWRKKVWAWWIENCRSEVTIKVLKEYSNQVIRGER